ncbi:hypothetical protein Cs7R123_61640 [Catellatospora sp. TT07R-123]|uniref:hypothetical protein n=1 Tax=Catellatospora sp. TT07R-123 TaxID=2733863 RepID=UPI001B09C2AC|nr:hypothetical protein [Catellatospora sp. TT07R-123]GHJ48822.1 hypothetical protein Cs7R123_61640 [Catellatospora sp. TT07R-123]
MTDNRLKGRVKGLFGAQPELEAAPEPVEAVLADPDAERQALQVLVLARRTADEHIATAQQESHRIRQEARGKAEDTAREARALVEAAREDAANIMAQTQAKAVELAREAQANAEGARRESEQLVSEARQRALRITEDARTKADELERDALQQYEDVVGSLEAKRDALNERIDALQQFDREYRARLRRFMNSQLDALAQDDPGTELDARADAEPREAEPRQPVGRQRKPAAEGNVPA